MAKAETISCTYGATSITIATPDYPEHWGAELDQYRSQALGGRIWTVARSTTVRLTPVLSWSRMTEAQYDALYSFIMTTVNGSKNEWTLVDWDSTSWTATYLGGIEAAEMADYDQYAVTMRLRLTS